MGQVIRKSTLNTNVLQIYLGGCLIIDNGSGNQKKYLKYKHFVNLFWWMSNNGSGNQKKYLKYKLYVNLFGWMSNNRSGNQKKYLF